jgi:hypothetical protein
MNGPLSRRSALAGALPALAALTIPAAAAMSFLTRAASPDAALFAMEPKLQALYSAWDAALHDQSVAERAYFDEKPEEPKYPGRGAGGGGPLGLVDAVAEYETAHGIWTAEVLALKKKHDIAALEQRADALGREFMVAFGEVADLKATTIAGLKFKARWAEYENEDEMRDSLIRDILALNA